MRKKKKLTSEQKAEKARKKREYEWIFVNGKQKRVKREPMIDGLPVDEFLSRNADPIWLVQNGMYELLDPEYFDDPQQKQFTTETEDDQFPF